MGIEEKPGELHVWDPKWGKTLFVLVTKGSQMSYGWSGEGSQEEAGLPEGIHGAQVWVFALHVLLSYVHLERV